MITKSDLKQLKKLLQKVQAGPAMTDEEIRITQRLVQQGLARDLSSFHGTRQRLYLRVWQITDKGKAVLAQETLSGTRAAQGLFSNSED